MTSKPGPRLADEQGILMRVAMVRMSRAPWTLDAKALEGFLGLEKSMTQSQKDAWGSTADADRGAAKRTATRLTLTLPSGLSLHDFELYLCQLEDRHWCDGMRRVLRLIHLCTYHHPLRQSSV